MRERDNVELVQSIYSAFARGDMNSVLAPFAEGVEFQHPMPQSIWPWAGSRSGRQGLAEFFAGVSETLEYERLEPHQFIAQHDSVASCCPNALASRRPACFSRSPRSISLS
jgi:ketosteroid isomerase-like protein